MIGLKTDDDAAVYRLTDELAVVMTVDVITPIVDDPKTFGEIAAANSVSDIYAMGGDVLMALNIAAIPRKMPVNIVADILTGGAEKVREAGGIIAGGHTINDEEPKYGLAVLGTISPTRVLTKAAARPGDIILLSKPLGIGAITTAFKKNAAPAQSMSDAIHWMRTLNRSMSELTRIVSHACTDVTGFSLLGHAFEIADKSGVRLEFDAARLPVIGGAVELAAQRHFPGGTFANQSAYLAHVTFNDAIAESIQLLLFTPETSGGLLITVPEKERAAVLTACREAHQPVWEIGRVSEGCGIIVHCTGESPLVPVMLPSP